MKRRLVVSYVALVTIALVLFTVPVAASSSSLLRRTLEQTATREAALFVPLVLRDDADAARAIRDRTRDFQVATGSRVRLVRAGADVPDDAQVRAALAGRSPDAVWGRSPLLGADGVSVVVPVREDGRTVAAVQVVAPSAEVDDEIRGIWRFRLGVGLAVLLVAGGLAVVLGSSLTRPLRRLHGVTRRLGEGDLSARAAIDGPPEVAELAGALNRSTQRTEALLASQRSFVADASHQLRTPLAAMRLAVDNVRETAAAPDPALEARLDGLDAEISRMGRLVEGLLDLARTEGRAAAPTAIDVAALLTERVELWSAALEEADLACRVRAIPGTTALVTEGALEQVLDNLLDNAVLAAPPGSVLEIDARDVGDAVEVLVRDHGPGLDADARARAFDRFWTTRPDAGSGLGLPVVRQLVERDGGSVTLEAPSDGGLRVRLRLPRRAITRALTRS